MSEERYPMLALVVRHGQAIRIASCLAGPLLGFELAWRTGWHEWVVIGLVLGAALYLVCGACLELVALVCDMLLPK